MQSDTFQKISDSESTEQTMKQPDSGKKSGVKKNFLWFLCGILWGITLTFIAGVCYLRHNLIQEIPLEDNFAQAANKVGPTAQKYGWQVSYNDCGLPRLVEDHPVEVYRFCKSRYAYELLQNEEDRKIACILPCSISIYRKSDGVTYLSKLNMPLITQLLGGSSILIFQEKISPEQRAIMSHFAVKKNETE